ncbi:MAG: hypothetical protein ABI867_37380 [Kofleriaceae bacterium]
MCTDALESEPECIPLLLVRARACIALRRDLEAQADLRDLIRLDPQCSLAYRLLGELAARRDENDSAAIFFREALRLDPGDREAADWLMIVDSAGRPVIATRLPPPDPAPVRFARGTRSAAPDQQDERPTKPFSRGSERRGETWKTPSPRPLLPVPAPAPVESNTITGRPPTIEPARPAPRVASRPVMRGPTPELPGFGDYLVATGILTRERLRAAQAYQRSMRVQLSTAIVTLGLATPQRIEWASVAHQSQLARDRAG